MPAAAAVSIPRNCRNKTRKTCVWEPYTLKQKSNRNNKGFYWIVTGCCLVFTPPFAFCAVTVIMLSPVGRALVK
jgi:hypothetical protein